jgi:hypothetical protein
MLVVKLQIPASNYHHLPRSLTVNVVISVGRFSLIPFPITFTRIATIYSPLKFATNRVSLNALKKRTILLKICLLSWHIFC